MSLEAFIDALTSYVTKSRETQNDSDPASRELMIQELKKLLETHDRTTVDDHIIETIKGIRKNPLNRFLSTITPRMKIASTANTYNGIQAKQREAFTLNEEERDFAEDLVARVQQLSFAFERLCELGLEHFVIHAEIRKDQPHPNAIDLSRISASLLKREEDWRAEVELITSFAHYELKSIVDMLRGWGITVDLPELSYITKTRNRFLAHPNYGGVMRKPRRTISIPHDGGPVIGSIAGLDRWGPISREYYLQVLGLSSPIDEKKERQANEQLCLSSKKSEKFSNAEVVRLKAFGLREPNLTKALKELADLLQTHVVPRIEALYEQAVKVFGFVPY